MSYIYNTRLMCKSNRKLLQKINPKNIIKDLSSEFVSKKNGAYHYITRNGTMHSSVIALSNEYPTEVFVAQFYSVEIDDSVIETYKYVNGYTKCIKLKPNYMYCISHLEEIMGKKTVKRFMKAALKQFKKIDSIEYAPDAKNDRKQVKHGIHSSITINVEDRDYKIEAYRVGRSFIEVKGFAKIKEDLLPSWQLIEREKNKASKVTHQMENNVGNSNEKEYEPIPF